ncbi:MAG: matrixin family metalloprotease [Acidobacteria bacterium]|nr:matrixin family metalloprotease [Acidobacteriota bacterium]
MPSHLLRLATVVLVAGAVMSVALSAQSSRALDPLDASGTVTYFIADGEPASAYRPSDRDLATWALQAWERSIEGTLRFVSSSEDEALIRVYWVTPDAGLYGEMASITVNGRRGAAVYVRPDAEMGGEVIARQAQADPLFRDTVVYLTCLHELGHALGLAHAGDFDDIMYFFGFGGDIPGFFNRYRMKLDDRDSIPRVPGLSTSDINRVRALYPRP